MFFVLLVLKNFFINSIKHVFENKNGFPKFSSQTQFFSSKSTKAYSQKLFFRTVLKNINQIDLNILIIFIFIFFVKITLYLYIYILEMVKDIYIKNRLFFK